MKTTVASETILAVERALVILKRLASRPDEAIGVRDLSRELGYSPAVTQKTLNTLKQHEFVRQDDTTERYSLGMGVGQIGLAMLSRLDVIRLARPHLNALTVATEETTFLAVRDGLRAVYVDKATSPSPIRMDAEIGADRPLNCTAVGKVLLAWAPSGIFAKAVETGAFVQATPNSITVPARLEAELREVQRLGYAVDRREYHPEACCVAAPIFDLRGEVVATITLSGPASRMEDRLQDYAELVKESAATISRGLGYPGANP